jgi:cell division topological specificity factor
MPWLKSIFAAKPASGAVAKNRLQMVLRHDRGDLSPGLLEEIRDEIIEVITKRLSLDREKVVVKLHHTARESRLVAEIPLLQSRPHRRR